MAVKSVLREKQRRLYGTAAEFAAYAGNFAPGDQWEFVDQPGRVDEFNGSTWTTVATNGAARVADQTVHAGERSPTSTTEGYLDVRTDVKSWLLTSTSAVAIGASSVANDMRIFGLVIFANAVTAVTAAVAGMGNESGTAKTLTFTGNISGTDAREVIIDFGSKGIVNDVGALTVTASVADKVLVLYRPNGA